jgi:radical SAM protein with 4Fe4S-binding SPASM domain
MEAERQGGIVDAKLTITNVCGARCATCPSWKQPERTMEYQDFKRAWEILNNAPEVDRILVNNVGDVNELSDSIRYLTHMEERRKQVIMTTNGNSLEYVPKIDVMVISFNGGTKETFEKTTGMDFDRVVGNIKAAYDQLKYIPYVELDCLIWKGNEGTEMDFYSLWKDFPGRLRISYKVENQGGNYFGLKKHEETKRIYCQYLDWLSIAPSGQVISCAHDFAETTNWGNIYRDKMSDIVRHPGRIKMQEAHRRGEFPGLCRACNFNTPEDGKIVFLK